MLIGASMNFEVYGGEQPDLLARCPLNDGVLAEV
jgi:hypothetical protein